MKRFFTLLFSIFMLTSCELFYDQDVTQQDLIGTWGFYINESSWGEVTINRYGRCEVCTKGYLLTSYRPEDYIYETGTLKIANNCVTIDIPRWPKGTFQIRPSRWVNSRYLIDPYSSGTSRVVIAADIENGPANYVWSTTW